jgi:hypothetical protein
MVSFLFPFGAFKRAWRGAGLCSLFFHLCSNQKGIGLRPILNGLNQFQAF